MRPLAYIVAFMGFLSSGGCSWMVSHAPLAGVVQIEAPKKLRIGSIVPGATIYRQAQEYISDFPSELSGLPRLVFRKEEGNLVRVKFQSEVLVYAAFPGGEAPEGWKAGPGEYSDTRYWNEDGSQRKKFSIYTRRYEKGEVLSGLPPFWVCVGVKSQ